MPRTTVNALARSSRELMGKCARGAAMRWLPVVALLAAGGGVLTGQSAAPAPDAASPAGQTAPSTTDGAKADVKPDANAIVEARRVLGEDSVQSIRYAGSGAAALDAIGADTETPLRSVQRYDVLIDYPASTMHVDIVEGPADAAPATAPLAHHVEAINGTLAWDADFVAMPAKHAAPGKARGRLTLAAHASSSAVAPRVNAAASLLRRQAIWTTPHGFLKAALANQPALRAAGSGTEVSFYAGTNRYVGFLNSKHEVERVRTWVHRPEGDVLLDTTYTDYAAFGALSFPTRIRQFQNGRPVLDATITSVEANVPVRIAVPRDLSE
jgi:hypothetical protein